MTPIDEAALKADPSDSEIMEIAGRWFHTGENQHRADGYYYRSLGTPTNVRGSDLIAFARALLQRSQPVAVVPAEQAEDLIKTDRAVLVRAAAALSAYLSAMRAEDGDDRESLMARIRGADKMAHAAYTELYAVLHSTASVSNREAGGS